MANQPIYLDPALTNVANAWVNTQESFIAGNLFPTVPVNKRTFKVPQFGKENLEMISDTTRTGLSKAKSVSYTRKYVDGTPLQEHALAGEVTQDDYDMTDDPFTPESDTTEFILERMALADEKLVASTVTNLSIVPGTTLSGTSQWTDANSDPFEAVRQVVKASGFVKYNTMALSRNGYLSLITHPAVLDRLKWAQGGAVSMDQLKQLFAPYGITNIQLGQAKANFAPEGTTESISDIWGNDVALGYVTDRPGLKQINGGYKFSLKDGRKVEKEAKFNPNYTEIVVNDYYSYQLLLPEAWYCFKSAFAN